MKKISNIFSVLCMITAVVVYAFDHTIDAIYIMTFAIFHKQND